jgi:UDP-N-acetylmuramoylalanine--D-glutamate ligase
MDEAVAMAAAAAQAGDVVLLSPGGTSYDMYRDFEERGRDFARAAQALGAGSA